MMNYFYNMMGYGNGYGTGFGFGIGSSITMLLCWVLMILGIVALWKYISGKK